PKSETNPNRKSETRNPKQTSAANPKIQSVTVRRIGDTRDIWSAPAERSGDGALDHSRTVVETLASHVPRRQNPERRGASLPAALQNAGALHQRLCCKHCLFSTCDALECAGRAQRRRRFACAGTPRRASQ